MDLPAVRQLPGLKMTRRLNWAVCALHCGDEELGSTAGVFDLLWAALGASGQRNLSVRQGVDGQFSALVFKGDQAEPDLGAIAQRVKVTSLSEIAKLGKGPSGSASIAKYVRAWFATAQEHTSNFRCLPLEEQGVEVQEAYERAMQMDEEEVALEQWQAQGLRRDQRDSFQKAICYGRGPLNTLRKLGRKRASKVQQEAGIVFRAGVNATQLVYPQDVPKLAAKKGSAYDPRSQKTISPSCDDYVFTKMHLEKVLVLWGPGGNGKTPSAEAIANCLAIGYGCDKYIKASSPESLKYARDEFGKGVVVILEELLAGDVSQNGRKLSSNYMKHLLDVTNGGQVRIRNTMLCFHPLQPRILCVNDQPDDWLKAIENFKDTDGLPLRKRLLFLHVDELVVKGEAIEAHDADLDAMVAEGKRRRLELGYGAVASASASTAPPSEDAPSEGSPSGSTAAGAFEQELEAVLDADLPGADSDVEEPSDTSDNNNRTTNQGVATGDESADADVRYVKETFQP